MAKVAGKRDCNRQDQVSKKIECLVCDRAFSRHQGLQLHFDSVHLNLRPGRHFKCDKCGKTYSRKEYLASHEESHGGERLMCELCGKTFATRITLKLHSDHVHLKKPRRKMKTSSSPVMCEKCGKTFATRGSMRRHMDGVHLIEKQAE